MPLRDFLNDLALDPELIVRDREMSAGLAKAHERLVQETSDGDADLRYVHFMAAATEYRRAGAHSLLLSDRKSATEMFRRAGSLYARLGKPYAVMMFSCADGDLGSIMASTHDFGIAEGVERTQLSYLILATAAGPEDRDREAFGNVSQRILATQNAPVGVLGIPVGAYLDLANVLADRTASFGRFFEAFLPFLSAYSMAIRRCMENKFHWERLAFPFHPTEPDVLGVLFCVEATLLSRQQGSVLEIVRNMPLGEVSMDLLYNAILDRFGKERYL